MQKILQNRILILNLHFLSYANKPAHMTDTVTAIETLFEKAQDYGKTSLGLLKLQTISRTSDVASTLAAWLSIFMVVTISVLIINIGIALWISEQLDNIWSGFFIVGIFYALIALVLFIFRHQWIKDPIHNSIIGKLQK
jgi:hypothetical protein